MRLASVATFGVYAFACLLQLWLVLNLVLFYEPGKVVAGALCSVVVLGLHCMHLRFALRGERSPHGRVTLAAMVVVTAAGQALVGYFWTWTWALVATSAILVLPLAGGLAVFAAVVAGAYFVAGDVDPFYNGLYWALTTAYRVVLLASVVWFVAAVRQLDELRAALARDAVSGERARLGADLGAALGDRLAGLTRGARRARELAAQGRDDEVGPVLEALAAQAREALDETRRTVTGLQEDGARGELAAARGLLTRDEAVGSSA